MTLLAWVAGVLDDHGVRYAVVGATALAAHGVPRATADIDLLTVDARCLDRTWWSSGVTTPAGVAIDVRAGDATDPLAGVVRFVATADASVDLIVGRPGWQDDLVRRAQMMMIAGSTVPVVDAIGLTLLKLYAGGPQDAWDVDQLLDAAPGLETEVEPEVGRLPADAVGLWRRILRDRA